MHLRSSAYAARSPLALIWLIVTVAARSTGPPTGKVRGKVSFKGQPVKEGTVTLLNPTEGGAYEASINSDGTYEVPGDVKTGEYVVEIKPLMEMRDTDPGKSPPAP